MERSDEVRDLVSALLGTFGTASMADDFLDALLPQDGVLFLGTDPTEWWDTREAQERVFRAQGAELQGAQATVSDAEGWVEGEVGWGAARLNASFGEGFNASMRFTCAAVRRDDGWKIVQGHLSIGIPNDAAVGSDLTV
jgi:ketosteroid isomerase-like protein